MSGQCARVAVAGAGKEEKRSRELPRQRHFTCVCVCVLLCFIDPRVKKIRNEASNCPGIFSRTLRFYYVASSPGSPLPHLLDGHRKLVGRSAIPAKANLWYLMF